MALITCILYLVAFVCFVAAAANVPAKFNLIGAGLAAWILPALIVALKALG
jgi:hypothetical protein